MSLEALYRDYIDCLNHRRWNELVRFVSDDVKHNGRPLGVAGYRAMLVEDCERIPDLRFDVVLVADTPPLLAARINFDCSPAGIFLGLAINGRRVVFSENVFYRWEGQRIVEVWSVLDKLALEEQLAAGEIPAKRTTEGEHHE